MQDLYLEIVVTWLCLKDLIQSLTEKTIMDKNDFEGESRAGSPRKVSSEPLKKQSFDRGTSDSEEEEEATISFAEIY